MLQKIRPTVFQIIFFSFLFPSWEVVYEFPQGLTLLDISCTSPTDVWAVGLNEMTNTNQIYYSNDGGESWELQYSDMDLSIFMVGLDMADNSTGFIAGVYMVWFPDAAGCGAQTANGGGSWNPISSPDAFISNFYSVTTLNSQESHLLGSWGMQTTNGLFSTYDGGNSWETNSVPTAHWTVSADFVGSEQIWVAAGIWPTDEENSNAPVQPYFHDLGIMDYENYNIDREIYEASIWHSTNGGNSWVQQFDSNNLGYLSDIDMVNENLGIAVGSGNNFNSQIYRTVNGGATWNQISFSSQNQHNLIEIQMVNANDGWAMGYSPNGPGGQPGTAILKTTDGGQSWTLLSMNEPIGLLGLSMHDEHIGYATGGNNLKVSRILKYDDGFYDGNFCALSGDVNGDGTINISDVVLTVNCVLGGTCSDCSDLNADGVVNVQDIILIVNTILGN